MIELARLDEKLQQWQQRVNPDIQKIVCAACLMPDGHYILGIRHFSIDMLISARQQGYDLGKCCGQGFVDNFGNYLTRGDARDIVIRNKQCIPEYSNELFSEDLY